MAFSKRTRGVGLCTLAHIVVSGNLDLQSIFVEFPMTKSAQNSIAPAP
jgi:hypothetical protein